MKIAVAGLGYVGISNAILLSQNNEVVAFDIDKDRVEMINNRISPFTDDEIEEYLTKKELNLKATTDYKEAFIEAKYVIIATPTDYNPNTNNFDTTSVETVIKDVLKINSNAIIIIRSTVPVGSTKKYRKKFNKVNIIFSPEFLREGRALYDNLYPFRIVVGDKSDKGIEFSNLLLEGTILKKSPILLTESTEAETIKLFSNTYLAMRISFFNELDSYVELSGLDAKEIIDGVSLDPRIGQYYNNPSFGYGGYCLPKDSKQLLENYNDIPQNIITAVVEANKTRKNHIAMQIINKNPKKVGIYRLTMKTNSDNFRQSAIIEIIQTIRNFGIEVIIYEPTITEEKFLGLMVEKDINVFLKAPDIIVANRITKELEKVTEKVYTRDIYHEN